MTFGIENIWSINIGGAELWITQTIVNTWIIMALLIALAIFVRIKLRRFQEIPKGFQSIIEAAVELFDNFMLSAVGERLMSLGTWFFTLFIFIFTCSLSGIIGMRPPTADWATTFALALMTLILIQVMGIKYRGKEYLKSFFSPHPVFFPLNLIGELARPVSLSFRLFGNTLSGLILMTLVYSLAPVVFRFAIPAALHAYFDIAIGALQTYIFCMLSLMFIKQATEE
ncbi:MAG: F0F1 ATP synthase subunit A [Christensenellales bacterium]